VEAKREKKLLRQKQHYQEKKRQKAASDNCNDDKCCVTRKMLLKRLKETHGPARTDLILSHYEYLTCLRGCILSNRDTLCRIGEFIAADDLNFVRNPVKTVFNFLSTCKELYKYRHGIVADQFLAISGSWSIMVLEAAGPSWTSVQHHSMRHQLNRLAFDLKKLPHNIFGKNPVKTLGEVAEQKGNDDKQMFYSRLAAILLKNRQAMLAASKAKLRPANGTVVPVHQPKASHREMTIEDCVTAQGEKRVVEGYFSAPEAKGWFRATILTVRLHTVGKCVILQWEDGDLRDTAKRADQIRFPV
jgi:hypothetical protein